MSLRIRKLIYVTGAVAAVLATSFAATGTAEAVEPWLNDPGSCTNVQTARSTVVSGRTVQVRYGNCNGKQYGWGRILDYGSGDYIRFEVDLNGDRDDDERTWKLATNRNYTPAYPTSTNPDRAFRACFIPNTPEDPTHSCNAGNGTSWW